MSESELLKLLAERQVWMDTADVLLGLGLSNDSWNSTVSALHDLAKNEVIQRRRDLKGKWEFGIIGIPDALAPDAPKVASDLPEQYIQPPVWTAEDGDYPNIWNRRGPYFDKPPKIGFRCGWSVSWLIDNPFPPPAVEDMERGALLLEAADACAQGRIPATMLLQAQEGGHIKDLREALRAARQSYPEAVGLWALSNPKATFLRGINTIDSWGVPLGDGLRYAKLRAGGWAITDRDNRIIHQLCGAPPPRGISRAEERQATAACRKALANTWRRR
jgi:hypothetical protein